MSGARAAAGSDVAGELRHIVRANEQIKAIIGVAFGIRIMALNAILLSRRAGDVARGFGVLSGELRGFAADLSVLMGDLRTMTESSVTTVTGLVKQARLGAILHRVCHVRGCAAQQLAQVRARHDAIVMRQAQTLIQVQRELQAQLERIEPVVLLGSVLARSARIEGAYGAGFAAELTEVAEAFAQTIETIGQALSRLKKSTQQE